MSWWNKSPSVIAILPLSNLTVLGINCNKNRGLICPGGKVEENESLQDAAKRELLEEAGVTARELDLIFQAHDLSGHYCYSFLVRDHKGYALGQDYGSGVTTEVPWTQLFRSHFGPYYQLLYRAFMKQ
jgi:8-oxo-dGTP pyrophosphatase MutT (NUDIX family)